MAYDEDIANRIRELIGGERDLTEQKMFGGLAFLIGGHIAIGASRDGGLLVRANPEDTDALIAKGKAEPAVMRGRTMSAFLRVTPDKVKTKRQLQAWTDRGVAIARTLPPKPKRPTRRLKSRS